MHARSDMRRSTRQLMENALTLDVNDLLRRGVLARGSWTRGVISWLGPAGEVAASVSYEADMASAAGRYLRLRFSTLDPQRRRSSAGRPARRAGGDASGLRRRAVVVRGRRPARWAAAPAARERPVQVEFERTASEPFDISIAALRPRALDRWHKTLVSAVTPPKIFGTSLAFRGDARTPVE